MRDLLRQPLFLNLAGSLALHLAFMAYLMALPPAPKLTPQMASERIARFVIARFPAPPSAKPAELPPPAPAAAPARRAPLERAVAQRPKAQPTPRPKRRHVAQRPTPEVSTPPAAVPIVVAADPGPEPEIQVVAAAAAPSDGPEGATTGAAPSADPAPESDVTVASSKYEPDGQQSPDLVGLRRGYIGRLNRYFGKLRQYPRRARRAGLEGTVLLELVLDEHGRIVEIRVAKSSGHRILDDAARAAVAALGSVPSPPGELHWRSQAVRIPFHYSLRS